MRRERQGQQGQRSGQGEAGGDAEREARLKEADQKIRRHGKGLVDGLAERERILRGEA